MTTSYDRFTDKTAIVTGAGSGIGKAVAERLAAEGAAVAAFDLDLDATEATVAGITATGGNINTTATSPTANTRGTLPRSRPSSLSTRGVSA